MLTASKARIAIVNPFEHGGGAEYQIARLIDALVESGRYEVHYLAHFVDAGRRTRSYRVHRVGAGGPIPLLGYLAETRSLYRALAAIDPHAIYQRVGGGYTAVCAVYARRRSIPLIWHAAHDTEVDRTVLDPARNIVRVRLEKWAAEYGLRRAARIVVQTHHQDQLLRRHFGRQADAVIPNFHPPAGEVIDKRGPLTVVWIANLKPWKRPEVFVRLAAALADLREVRFVMVGAASEDDGWQQALMREIAATPNLEYVGVQSLAQVNSLLGRAHIFVNTSLHEGFPNTFIQSWLREAAVVSLQVDPDRVMERQGVGIAARTEEGLQAGVRGLIQDPAARLILAERGRRHAAAHHSLANAGELIRLIDGARQPEAAAAHRR
jgi:glycosyltransferase involved in cell wall biosynthesis